MAVSPPSNTRFPRNTTQRSTFHGGPVHRQRASGYGGAAPPTQSQDTSAMGPHGQRGMSFFNKLTSKFSRRCVSRVYKCTRVCSTQTILWFFDHSFDMQCLYYKLITTKSFSIPVLYFKFVTFVHLISSFTFEVLSTVTLTKPTYLFFNPCKLLQTQKSFYSLQYVL